MLTKLARASLDFIDRHDWLYIIISMAVTLIVAFFFMCIFGIASADFSGGNTIYYGPNEVYNSSLADANNSYVHQGDNITQGSWYDLSGNYGFSGILAHWNDDVDDAGVTTPDYTFTLTNPYQVYIDPAKFPVGRWYQWDGAAGCYGGTINNNNGGTILGATPTTASDNEYCLSGFGNDNDFVFTVVPAPAPSPGQNITVIKSMNITAYIGNQTVEIPVTYTEIITPNATPTIEPSYEQTVALSGNGLVTAAATAPQGLVTLAETSPQGLVTAGPETTPVAGATEDVQDINGNPVNGVVPVQEVTASPVPVSLGIIGLGIGILIWRRK